MQNTKLSKLNESSKLSHRFDTRVHFEDDFRQKKGALNLFIFFLIIDFYYFFYEVEVFNSLVRHGFLC